MLLNNLPIFEIKLPLTSHGLSKEGYVLMDINHAPVPYTVNRLILHWPRTYIPNTKPNPDYDSEDPGSPLEIPTNQLDYLEENCFCILVWVTEVSIINGSIAKAIIQEHKGVLYRRMLTQHYNLVDPLSILISNAEPNDPYEGLYRLINPVKDYRTESGLPDFLDVLDLLSVDFTEAEKEYYISYSEIDTNFFKKRKATTLQNKVSFEIYSSEIVAEEDEKPPFVPINLYWCGMTADYCLEELTKYYACRVLANDITDINKTESVYQWRRRVKIDDTFTNRIIVKGYYPIQMMLPHVTTPSIATIPIEHLLSPLKPWLDDNVTDTEYYANSIPENYGSIIFPYLYYYENLNGLLVVYEDLKNYIKSSNVNFDTKYEIYVTPHDYSWYYEHDWDEAEIFIDGKNDYIKLNHFTRPTTRPVVDPTFNRKASYVATRLSLETNLVNNVVSMEDGFKYPPNIHFNLSSVRFGFDSLSGDRFYGVYDGNGHSIMLQAPASTYPILHEGELVSEVETSFIPQDSSFLLKTLSTYISHEVSNHPLVWKTEVTEEDIATLNNNTLNYKYNPGVPISSVYTYATVVYNLQCTEEELNEYWWNLVIGPDPEDDTYVSPLKDLVPLEKFLFDKYVHKYYERHKRIDTKLYLIATQYGVIPCPSGAADPEILATLARTLPITINYQGNISSLLLQLGGNATQISAVSLPEEPETDPDPEERYTKVDRVEGYLVDMICTVIPYNKPVPSFTNQVPVDLEYIFQDYIQSVLFSNLKYYLAYKGSTIYPS